MTGLSLPARYGLTALVLACLAAVPTVNAADDARATAGTKLGHPGYLVIEAALDSTAGFQWHLGPGRGERSLVWADGVLTAPDTMAFDSLRGIDLAVPCGADLAGVGASGALAFRDGIFPVSEPILLSDGVVDLYVMAGELEIREQRIRYTAPEIERDDPRAGYLMLAGVVILVVVMMRRVALQRRRRGQE